MTLCHVYRPADRLLELEDLLKIAKQNGSSSCQDCVMESSGSPLPASESTISIKSSNVSDIQEMSNGRIKPSSSSSKQMEANESLQNGSSLNVKVDSFRGSLTAKKHEKRPTETNGMHKKQKGKSILSDLSESRFDSSVLCGESIDFSDICSESFSLSEIHSELMDEANKGKKFCVAKLPKNKSINVDFRLSRGIAQVIPLLGT